MDNITQGVIGGAIYTLITGKYTTKSIIIGGIVTNLPDLDIFIGRLIYDTPIKQFFFHRGILHSLFMAGFIGVIVGFVLWYKNRGDISLWRYIVGIFCSISLGHLVIDGFTSYGIRYFLPRSNQFYSRDNMPVVDIFLLCILVILFVVFVVVKYKKYISICIISISILWFGASFFIKDAVNYKCNSNFTKYGLDYGITKVERFGSFPNFGSLFNWKCLYITEDKIYLSDHNIFSKNDIVWTQVASYNIGLQKDMISNLYSKAADVNKDTLDIILGRSRGYKYITQIGDNKYLIQNLIFTQAGSQELFGSWVIDISPPKRTFRNLNDDSIGDMINILIKEFSNSISKIIYADI